MTATFQTANDEILAKFKAAWDTTGFVADYPNVRELGVPPATPAPWARVRLTFVPGGEGSLAGDDGSKRYERSGFVTIQIFVPAGEGLSRALTLAKLVADAFEGKKTTSQVWFYQTTVRDIGPDGDWYQTNVVVLFRYDEVK